MNIRDLIKRPTKPHPPVKQLKATARRATIADEPDYYDDEPNVRLSRAFLVVMLLHVVAVGGIFAFSSLKKERAASVEESKPAGTAGVISHDMPADSRIYIVGQGENLGDVASAFGVTRNDLLGANHLAENAVLKEGDKLVIPAKSTTQPVPLDVQKLLKLSQKTEAATKTAPAKATDAPRATGKTYVVQKGDNPVGIAKKLKVKYADLIKANNITDPRKLQIGQKLIVPE